MSARFDIVTIFPGMFENIFNASIIGKAQDKGLVEIQAHDLRDWTEDKHKTTDDYPYGGGAGMVMKVEPFSKALVDLKREDSRQSKVVLMTPQGRPFSHSMAKELSTNERLIILCGRYEGVDERVRSMVDMEISIGDYVLTGGEIAAMVVIDAVTRLIPGVLGDENSPLHDSHADVLLEHPHYTRPPEYNGMKVPEILLNGHHAKIEEWRRRESITRTAKLRPDLIDKADLTDDEQKLAEQVISDGRK